MAPTRRSETAPRRSSRVTELEKVQTVAQKKAEAAALAAKKQAATAARTAAKASKETGKAVKRNVVRPAAKAVAEAAGVEVKDGKAKGKGKGKKAPVDAAPAKAGKARATATTTKKEKKAVEPKVEADDSKKKPAAKKSAAKKTAGAKPTAATTAASTKKAKAATAKKVSTAKESVKDTIAKKAAATTKAAPAKKPAKADPEIEAKAKTKVGSIVPDVTLRDEDDKEVSLKSLYDEAPLVIFSYPKADTPGCTTQACLYRDSVKEGAFAAVGYTVLGLSRDKPTAQNKWKTKHTLGYTLLSDPQGALLGQLGQTADKKRCHWVIEKGGKLLEAKHGVKPADDAKNALDFIKSLATGKTE